MSSVIERDPEIGVSVEPPDRILRFSLSARIEHVVQLVTFVVLALTGLIQKFFEFGFSKWMIELLGGLPRVRYIHRFFATILMIAVIFHMGKAGYKKFVEDRPRTMIPGKGDWVAIKQSVAYLMGRRHEPAPQGRFTFAEKMEYWSFVWGTVLMVITGYMLWNPITTARFLPGDFIPAAKAAHGGEALLALLAILVWHIYHVHIKLFNKSIFTGYLTREEMLEEHPLELAAIDAGTAGPRATPQEQEQRRKRFLPVFAVAGLALLGGTWWFISYEETAISTIEPLEDISVFKPLPPEGTGHVTPPLSEDNAFPSTTTEPPVVDTTQPLATGELSWDDPIAGILASSCGACHSGSSARGGIDLSTYDTVMATPGLVVPDEPADSSLLVVPETGGHPGQFSPADGAAVAAWINQGAREDGPGAAADLTWGGSVGATINLRCGNCHGAGGAAGGIDLSSYEAVMATAGVAVPGDPDGSLLIQVPATGGHPGQFSDDELAEVRQWIADGAMP